jgi:hypothetical protein
VVDTHWQGDHANFGIDGTPLDQHFIFTSKQLEGGHSLSDYIILRPTTLHHPLPPWRYANIHQRRSLASISPWGSSPRTRHTIYKRFVTNRKSDIPPNQQRLIFGGGHCDYTFERSQLPMWSPSQWRVGARLFKNSSHNSCITLIQYVLVLDGQCDNETLNKTNSLHSASKVSSY